MKNLLMSVLVVAVGVGMTGCMTQSRVIADGDQVEVVAGFSQDDIDYAVSKIVQNINKASERYAKPGVRRVINVKDVTNDTLSRGRDAGALAEALGQSIREELTNSGSFIVYNEKLAVTAQNRVLPEFVMFGRLTQRNMRKDNGDVYQEFSLNIQLVDVKTGLEFWQKRVPIRKEVDKRNSMN